MLCPICQKTEIYSTSEDTDYCIICWFTGRYFEAVLNSDERANMLERIRAIPNVTSADVWHFGGGMFNLAVMLKDGRMITPGAPAQVILGQQVVLPVIPPAGESWAIMVRRPIEGENEWEGPATILPEVVDDEGVVKTIEEIA